LGSVRQIVDANGNVTLAESYEPYGSVLTSTGTASSIFAYAGEQIDTTGLIYLRARYMNPRLVIFLARDPWSGDVLRPGSMNGFNYVEGNPVNFIDINGLCPIGRWDCNTVGNIQLRKRYFLDSAARHNRIPTMDTNGFAALIASVIASEQRLGGMLIPNSPQPNRWLQLLEDSAALWGCVVSGDPIKKALDRKDWGQAIRYISNRDIPPTDDLHAYASVGIGNVKLKTAADLWKGQACTAGQDTDCMLVTINKLQTTNAFGQLVDLHNPFDKKVVCAVGNCAVYEPSKLQSYQELESQLLDDKNNIEYVAANLEAGALRATTIGLQPSAFNAATWHLRGIQSDDEIINAQPPWKPCPLGACFILEEISSALTAWGITSNWNLSSEPQYAYWKYH
jgi:RHS repeat-associated protein